jgi:cyclase
VVKLEPATVVEAGQLFEAGAARVAVQAAALRDPSLIASLTRTFGSEALAVAITAGGEHEDWRVFVSRHGEASEWDAVTWARVAEAQGAGELIVESRSGGRHGGPFDLELLAAVSAAVARPVVASGDPREIEDLFDALMIGNANAVVVGSLVRSGRPTVREVKVFLAEHGLPLRLDP